MGCGGNTVGNIRTAPRKKMPAYLGKNLNCLHMHLCSQKYTHFFSFRMIPHSDISRTLQTGRLGEFHSSQHAAFPGPFSAFHINVLSPGFRQINASSPWQGSFRSKCLSRFHIVLRLTKLQWKKSVPLGENKEKIQCLMLTLSKYSFLFNSSCQCQYEQKQSHPPQKKTSKIR